MLVQSRLSDGSALSVEVAGDRPPEGITFRLEITGENGVLTLDGGAIRGFQSGRLTLSLNGKQQPVDEGELAALPETAENVAGVMPCCETTSSPERSRFPTSNMRYV